MPYPFDQIFAVDPERTDMVAANSSVLVFEPGDATKTPLTLTTLSGLPLQNPVPTNDRGFTVAPMAEIPEIAWESGDGHSGTMKSFTGVLSEAVAARQAAQDVKTRADSGEFIGQPGPQGQRGLPGVNAIPASEAVAEYALTPGNPLHEALRDQIASEIDLGRTPSMGDAVGEWWIRPLATYQDRPYPRTVFGAIGANGDVLACEFNHATGKTVRTVVGKAGIDDHNVPSLIAIEGRRPILSWTNHNADMLVRMQVGSRSGDLGSLAAAAEFSINIARLASYTQWHFIPDASTQTRSRYWVFTRGDTNNWYLLALDVEESTGAVSLVFQRGLLSGGGRQSYLSTADAYSAGQQVIRCGFGFNPAQPDNQLYYFEINAVTGDVTGQISGPTPNVIQGANLALSTGVLTPLVDQTAADVDRRFFYTRPGPDRPALAYAEWPLSKPGEAVYKVAESFAADPERGMIPQGGYVKSGTIAQKSAQWASGLRMEFRVKLAPTPGLFTVRLGLEHDPVALFSIRPDGSRRVRVKLNDSVIDQISAAKPFADLAGQTIDVRLDVSIAEKTARQYWSNDNGATWNQIGTYGVEMASTVTSIAAASVDDLFVVQGSAAAVHKASLRTLPGLTTLAAVDFLNAWPPHTDTYTSPDGMGWQLMAGAYVGADYMRLTIDSFGISGPSIESYTSGEAVARNYIAGMAFEDPSYDRTVITAHSTGGKEQIRKHRATAGSYTTETIREQPTSVGRLVRPYPPVNGGAIPTTATQLTRYGAYTSYEGNIVAT